MILFKSIMVSKGLKTCLLVNKPGNQKLRLFGTKLFLEWSLNPSCFVHAVVTYINFTCEAEIGWQPAPLTALLNKLKCIACVPLIRFANNYNRTVTVQFRLSSLNSCWVSKKRSRICHKILYVTLKGREL